MNLKIKPKFFIKKKNIYLNKKSNHKNDDPQQSNIVI